MSLLQLQAVGRTVELPDGASLPILTDVNLTVEAGEHIAVVGRSGSGKSTLLNLLGLLDVPTSGRYLINGHSVADLPSRKRAHLRGKTFGFVFQQFNLLPRRSAVDNVATPLLYATGRDFWHRRRSALTSLDRVGLLDRADSPPELLSGGEQQRVAIARALVRGPRVVLADEPTGSLDVETGAAVMDLLERTSTSNGATLVTITHDVSVASRADRQFRLDHGRLFALAGTDVPGATSRHAADHTMPLPMNDADRVSSVGAVR